MTTDADRIRLRNVRDLLMPGLYGHNARHPNLRLDMEVGIGCLMVKGFNPARNRSLGFAITIEQIKDGAYKSAFTPNVIELVKKLEADLSPDEEKRLGL